MNARLEAQALQMHVVSRGHLSVADARQYIEAEARRRRILAATSSIIATIAALAAVITIAS